MIYYYLTVFPMEALIASQLEPKMFASYMAMGSRKGSAEQLIFISVTPECCDSFDWKHAIKHCVPHKDGKLKNSVYLSIYRVLEHLPLDALGTCYLVTKDGLSLSLEKSTSQSCISQAPFHLYQEICPATPLAISSLQPDEFSRHIIKGTGKISLPAMLFVDLKVIDFDDMQNSGNVGGFYDRNIEHLKECLFEVQGKTGKKTKIVDRSYSSRFSYQVIGTGIFAAKGDQLICYPMPSHEELKRIDYDWGRSALIF
ncbi:MAG: hypothetical protein PF518_17180 [Spirochaetaceae bacterium]|jgi:hypothetical protein|nr:hypothetical protein [Spirochaetaceae bacterium]